MNLTKIENLCIANNTNISQLERDCNLANATIRRWATSSPSADNLAKVANYFGVSVDYLLGRTGYDISESARINAVKYDALPAEKRNLINIYLSVLETQ